MSGQLFYGHFRDVCLNTIHGITFSWCSLLVARSLSECSIGIILALLTLLNYGVCITHKSSTYSSARSLMPPDLLQLDLNFIFFPGFASGAICFTIIAQTSIIIDTFVCIRANRPHLLYYISHCVSTSIHFPERHKNHRHFWAVTVLLHKKHFPFLSISFYSFTSVPGVNELMQKISSFNSGFVECERKCHSIRTVVAVTI